MQPVAIGQTLHRADTPALRLDREHQAGAHRFTIEDDGAGAADAVLAADMGPGLAAVIADHIDQRAPWLHAHVVILAVDVQGDVDFLYHRRLSRLVYRRLRRPTTILRKSLD